VVKFKDELVADGKAPKTIIKQVRILSSILEWATNNDLIQANPTKGVKVATAKTTRESRLPYSSGDLQRIFSSPIYTTGERPRAAGGEAAYWIPLLALFTGCRLEELAQALTGDVKEVDGIHVLEITDQGDGQQVKTKGSRRLVPIHPELLKLGFLEYAAQMRAAKQEKLFPKMRPDRHGKLSQGWSKWWGRYVRDKVKITDPRKVFHSFRHAFVAACRASGIEEEMRIALTGHAGGTVGRSYGGAYPLRPPAEAMPRLRYDGLDFSKVKVVATPRSLLRNHKM
jgi:integrase